MDFSTKAIQEKSDLLFKNGFVQIKNLLNKEEITKFENGCNLVRKKPTPFKILKKDSEGEFFMDYNNWRKHPEIFNLCNMPKITKLIKAISNSKKCWLMHEDIIIKSGSLVSETPIHHDRPYFIFKGDLNLSLWLSITDVQKDCSLVCFKGSHLMPELVLPKQFNSGKNAEGYKGLSKDGFTELNDEIVKRYEPIDFDIEAGDGIIFFNKTLHSSKKHTSKKPRINFVIRYLLDGSKLTRQHYNNVPPYERMGVNIVENDPVPEKFFPELLS